MVDKRSLRSNKPANSTSANGDKVTSPAKPSQGVISSSQGKSAPGKVPSTRTKSGTNRTTASGDSNMGEDKPQMNGSDPVENGVNGTSEDIEMEDSPAAPAKGNIDKDGDDEMTVVFPPPKSSKLLGNTSKDMDGDMEVDGIDKNVEK